ncbi:TPA: PerC family transcriptional regulator [Klebsiella pneumoniae]
MASSGVRGKRKEEMLTAAKDDLAERLESNGLWLRAATRWGEMIDACDDENIASENQTNGIAPDWKNLTLMLISVSLDNELMLFTGKAILGRYPTGISNGINNCCTVLII